MRIGALITGILCWVISLFQLLYILKVTQRATTYVIDYTDNDLTFLELSGAVSYSAIGIITPIMIIFLLVHFCWITVYFQFFSTRKAVIIIGAILATLATLSLALSWFFNQIYQPMYMIACGLYSLGMLFFGFSMISYQDRFKMGAFLGPIIGLLAVLVFGVMGATFEYDFSKQSPLEIENYINMHLIAQNIYSFLLGGFCFLFSFSKRYYFEGTKGGDFSVSEGSAFASYVAEVTPKSDTGKAKNIKEKKKEKKKKESTELDFEF